MEDSNRARGFGIHVHELELPTHAISGSRLDFNIHD